ncbi:MAG: hypothetical protein HZB10_00015 [Candidatus Yonathbacteria bacterium]|nr:hypothetical protein [Candidatus Yonathbacteria bacterium]
MNNLQNPLEARGQHNTNPQHTLQQEVLHRQAFTSPDQVEGQLNLSEDRYKEALENLIKGDLDELEYLQSMKQNLSTFKTIFYTKFGTLSGKNKEIAGRVESRLKEINGILNSVAH